MNATTPARTRAIQYHVFSATACEDCTQDELLTASDRLSQGGTIPISIQEYTGGSSWRWIVQRADVPETFAIGPRPIGAPLPVAKADPAAALASLFASAPATIAERNAAPEPEKRSTWGATIVDDLAATAIKADHAELSEAGFALPRPFYAVGTVLAESGVASFAAKKEAWERAPKILDACDTLIGQVHAEDRRDVKVRVGDLRMHDDGSIDRGKGRIALTENMFGAFCARVGMPAAGEYLRKCDPSLRAHNVNAWIERNASKEIVLRTSLDADKSRRVYAVVGERYAECNADKIAEAMKLAMRGFPDARGHVTYDPDNARVKIEAEFMAPISPKHAAVGEVWRATVRAFGDDTGGGSLKGGGGVSMALCLNFTYADVNGYTFQIRHLGRVQEIARRLREGIQKSVAQIEGLVTRWGFACEENVVETSRALASAEGTTIPVPASLAMPWLFAGIIERELVPVVGRKQEAVKRLVQAHEADGSSAVRGVTSGISRASIVNSLTRYAHTEINDPWITDEIQRKASALLWSEKPLPVADPSTL